MLWAYFGWHCAFSGGPFLPLPAITRRIVRAGFASVIAFPARLGRAGLPATAGWVAPASVLFFREGNIPVAIQNNGRPGNNRVLGLTIAVITQMAFYQQIKGEFAGQSQRIISNAVTHYMRTFT